MALVVHTELTRSEQLAKLRKGANRNTKLTVSRMAKRTIKPPYSKHGNERTMARYVMETLPKRQRTQENLKVVLQRVNNVVDYTGEFPTPDMIRSYVRPIV